MVQAEMVVAWIQLQVGDVGRTLTVEAEGPADGSDVKKRGGCCFHYSKSTATRVGEKGLEIQALGFGQILFSSFIHLTSIY